MAAAAALRSSPVRTLARRIALAAFGAGALIIGVPAGAAAQTITPGPNLGVFGSPVPGTPVFVAFTNTFNPDLSTTVFQVSATSPDGGGLSYAWRISAPCGSLTAPAANQPTNGYYHGPDANNPNGCPPPPGIEIQTVVTVAVFRTADNDPLNPGHPKKDANYFEYSMVARAADEPATQGFAANAQLDYFGTAPPAPGPTSTPPPTAPPTATVTSTTPPVLVPDGPRKEGSGPIGPLLIVALIAFLLVGLVAWFLYSRRARTVELPPVEKCAKERADLERAEASARAARAKFEPLKAARDRLSAAQVKQSEAQQEWDRWQKASGAELKTDTASSGDKVITKTHWSYKYPSNKGQAEKARAALDAADADADAAQKAFDQLGGWNAYSDASSAMDKAEAELKTARAALEKCLGTTGPASTGTDGGGVATGGGTGLGTGGGVPPTVATIANPCEGKPEKSIVAVEGDVYENALYRANVTREGYFSSGDDVKDLVKKFGQAKDAIDIGLRLKDAITNPVGSIKDTLQDLAIKYHKLPPKNPAGSSYQDMMINAIPDAIDGLVDKLNKLHSAGGTYTVAWPRFKYHYRGSVTCECQNGSYVVKGRDFSVDQVGSMEIVTKELGNGGTLLADEVSREIHKIFNAPIAENDRSVKKLYDEEAKMNQAGCE